MNIKQKRNLFTELKQGIAEIKAHRAGKITLRTHIIKHKERPHVDAALIRDTRENFLHMSRTVFALKLRVSPRTLEKWEQGKTVPNVQAAALILLVRKHPNVLQWLEDV